MPNTRVVSVTIFFGALRTFSAVLPLCADFFLVIHIEESHIRLSPSSHRRGYVSECVGGVAVLARLGGWPACFGLLRFGALFSCVVGIFHKTVFSEES